MQVEVSRGPGVPRRSAHRCSVTAGSVPDAACRCPRRLADLAGPGWFSGDLHVHMNYGGAYRNDPRSAGVSGSGRGPPRGGEPDRQQGRQGARRRVTSGRGRIPASDRRTLIAHGQEYHTSFWGHVGLLGLRRQSRLAGLHRVRATRRWRPCSPPIRGCSIWPARKARWPATSTPIDAFPDPSDTTRALTHALPVDVALGQGGLLRGARLRGRSDGDGAGLVPAAQLRFPAAGGRRHRRHGKLRLVAGTGGDESRLRAERWAAGAPALALRAQAGRSFATNGPLLEFSVNGPPLGDEVGWTGPGW